MKRREFLSLCGLVAGSCLVPEAMARVIRDTCVLARQPYLVLPRDPSSTLYAMPIDDWALRSWEHRSAWALGLDPADAGPDRANRSALRRGDRSCECWTRRAQLSADGCVKRVGSERVNSARSV